MKCVTWELLWEWYEYCEDYAMNVVRITVCQSAAEFTVICTWIPVHRSLWHSLITCTRLGSRSSKCKVRPSCCCNNQSNYNHYTTNNNKLIINQITIIIVRLSRYLIVSSKLSDTLWEYCKVGTVLPGLLSVLLLVIHIIITSKIPGQSEGVIYKRYL